MKTGMALTLLCTLILAASSSHAQNNRAANNCPNKRACIEVVLDKNNCPVYTRYKDRLNGVPALVKDSTKKIRWFMVNFDGVQQNVAFKVYFDPFRNVDVQGTGMADSKRLDPDIPAGVEFKYTVVVEGCQPLDPIIRVN